MISNDAWRIKNNFHKLLNIHKYILTWGIFLWQDNRYLICTCNRVYNLFLCPKVYLLSCIPIEKCLVCTKYKNSDRKVIKYNMFSTMKSLKTESQNQNRNFLSIIFFFVPWFVLFICLCFILQWFFFWLEKKLQWRKKSNIRRQQLNWCDFFQEFFYL